MNTPQLTCTIPAAIQMTGLSRSTFYNLINSGQLTRIKVGKRALLKVADIENFINGCRQVPANG